MSTQDTIKEQVTGNRRVMETEARVTPDQDQPKTIRSLDM